MSLEALGLKEAGLLGPLPILSWLSSSEAAPKWGDAGEEADLLSCCWGEGCCCHRGEPTTCAARGEEPEEALSCLALALALMLALSLLLALALALAAAGERALRGLR